MVVVGGANSAGQAALHLAESADRVTMLVRAESLGRRMSRYLVERIEAHERIDVRTATELVDAESDDRLHGVVVSGLAGEERISAEVLFVIIGAHRSPLGSRSGCASTRAATS